MSAPARTPDQGSWETITAALEHAVGPGRPSGAWTKYCCPVHEAGGGHHKPSLGVKYSMAEQRTVVRCFAGCDNEIVLDALGLQVRDMFDRKLERGERGVWSPRPRPRQVSRADRALDAAGLPLIQPKKPDLGAQLTRFRTVEAYPYVGDDGVIVGEVVREEARFEGGRDKQFHQRRWNPRTGRMESGGFEAIPYRLPQVLETIAAGGVVYVCEGEKDVAAAESAGLTATTNAGGAMVWNAEHAKWLEGARTVVIVVDRDTAGYRRAERVMGSLVGLVERVRVVQAATGKDLHDHIQAGREIAELEPIPHLDPYTPARATVPAPPAAGTASAGPAPPLGSVSPDLEHPAQTPAPEGDLMPESLIQHFETPTLAHSDEVDHMHSQWSTFAKLLMQHMLMLATKMAQQRAAAAEDAARKSEQAAKETAERTAAEMAAVETRLGKLRKAGHDTASRTEIAEAVRDAMAWSADSEVASLEMGHLAQHVSRRFGVTIDLDSGEVDTIAAADPVKLAEIEQQRAAAARARKAQDRMVEIVAGHSDLDESDKTALYAAIESWRSNPTPEQLDALTRQLNDRKVPEQTRTRVRFVVGYLGTPAEIGTEETDLGKAVSATRELSRLSAPLVDPGEEAKPRIDKLLVTYQDQLKVGAPTTEVQEELAREVAVLTATDQEAARARGKAIRSNPAGTYPRMWPQHVDRDELANTIRDYAILAPQAERVAAKAGDLSDVTAVQLAKQAAAHKKTIKEAITTGEGLHDLEKEQIKAVMRDIEAGKAHVPELLFADDRSAARVDIRRSERIAYNTRRAQRGDLDQILETGAVPAGVREQIREHFDRASDAVEAANRQVATATATWSQRREAVVIARAAEAVEAVGYDSPERQKAQEKKWRAAGLDEDQIAERMAADASFATPPTAAVKPPKLNPRSTDPGSGMRFNHRGKGKGPEQQGNGR